MALAQPAAAGQTGVVGPLSSWAYTDSVSPFKSFANGTGDMPVGAWRDPINKLHVSKSYFTFRLPEVLRDAQIFGAEVNVRETSTNDCTKPRSTELWLTDTNERPTWQYQPREHVRLPGPGRLTGYFGFLGWSAGDVVRQAVTAGQSVITLALRMPGDKQRDPAYGRRYAPDPVLFITYNRAPNVPTELTFDNRPCGTDQFLPRAFQHTPEATVTDPDGDNVSGQFALWPVDQPDQRFERTSVALGSGTEVSVGLPEDLLADDRTYEWTVRAFDGDDHSAWAPSCRFTTDFTLPAIEPTVSAVDGGPGQPWQFTFTANGVPDVVGFRYGLFSTTEFVAADRLGGAATVALTPRRSGRNSLSVHSVDRAGNWSPEQRYDFYVVPTEPIVEQTDPAPGYGMPTELRIWPQMANVVSYTYTLNAGPETTVAAAADGTAVISVVPQNPALGNLLDIWSTTSTGQRSGVNHYRISVTDEPRVHSDDYPEDVSAGGPGVPGRFTFRPRQPDVVEYEYYINSDFSTPVIVPAAPDGTATATFTPTESGFHIMTVYSRSAEHGRSGNYTNYYFEVGS